MASDMNWIIGAFALGLAITLVLGAFQTPGSWWKRPNLRALAFLLAGTWSFGSLLLALKPAGAAPVVEAIAAIHPVPLTASRTFQVFEALNLRAASGIGARRVAVVPVGAKVTTTGERDGDWWEVSASLGGKPVTGWVSSLWLRRADELALRRPHARGGPITQLAPSD
jgi:hypothetical protein